MDKFVGWLLRLSCEVQKEIRAVSVIFTCHLLCDLYMSCFVHRVGLLYGIRKF